MGRMEASASKDLGSVLSHVETLQKQLIARENELKESKQREEEARRQAEQLNNVNMKLTEAKREAMKQEFNGKVRDWIKDMDSKMVPDTLKEEFLSSCERFADKGDETGVWKVVCCASAAHQHQVNTIQKLTEDYNTLKKTVEGQFGTEESRKRKEMEPATVPAVPSVWEQLEGMCKAY
jgi:hypothetical protein